MTEFVSLNAVRAATRNLRLEHVAIIRLCNTAGRPGLAAEMIGEGIDVPSARRRLESLSAAPPGTPAGNGVAFNPAAIARAAAEAGRLT